MRPVGAAAMILLAPALAALLFFLFIPVFAAVLLSLTDFDLYGLADTGNVRFTGLDNYSRLLHDPVFWTSVKNTAYFVLLGGPLSLLVSLAAALAVNARLVRFKGLFRTLLFLPVVTTLVAVAIVWAYLYHPRYGPFNLLLDALGLPMIDWLGDPDWAMPALILLAVWKNFGFNMVIFIAGLNAIPQDLYEAARCDGAGALRQFWHVTLPGLAPTFVFVAILTLVGYLQLFAEPYVMTQGGPLNSTLSVVLYMYQEGFRWWNLGYAAAIALTLFLMILALTLLQLRLTRRRT